MKRLEEEASKQKELEEARIKGLEDAFKEFAIKAEEMEKSKMDFEDKSSKIEDIIYKKDEADQKVIELEKQLEKEIAENKEMRIDAWNKEQLFKWRKKSWIEFSLLLVVIVGLFIYLMIESEWDTSLAGKNFEELQSNFIISGFLALLSFVFTGVSIKTLIGKYRNHSNIQNFLKGLKIPKELR